MQRGDDRFYGSESRLTLAVCVLGKLPEIRKMFCPRRIVPRAVSIDSSKLQFIDCVCKSPSDSVGKGVVLAHSRGRFVRVLGLPDAVVQRHVLCWGSVLKQTSSVATASEAAAFRESYLFTSSIRLAPQSVIAF